MQEEDKEEVEEVTILREVKKDQEVEMVEETAVGKKEEKEVGGAKGPMGSADIRTKKVKLVEKLKPNYSCHTIS